MKLEFITTPDEAGIGRVVVTTPAPSDRNPDAVNVRFYGLPLDVVALFEQLYTASKENVK